MKKPPSKTNLTESKQFELFGSFVANTTSDMSNIARTWEKLPKYFPARKMNALRNEDGLAKTFTHEYKIDGIPHKVRIQPALIQDKNSDLACFPTATEELIEEVLKKILTDQQYGLHNASKRVPETWVRFSLSMIERELKSRGKTRNRNEIKHSIQVLSKSIYTLYIDNKEVWSGSILQDLITVDRSDFLANPDELHAARLPVFISKDIESLNFRQYNYGRFMQIERQLTRTIYKLLVNKYTYANTSNTYHFMFSSIKTTGLLQKSRERDNRADVNKSLKELVESGVLDNYQIDEKKDKNKVIDVKYVVTASARFTTEQKAANKRETDNQNLIQGKETPTNLEKIAELKKDLKLS